MSKIHDLHNMFHLLTIVIPCIAYLAMLLKLEIGSLYNLIDKEYLNKIIPMTGVTILLHFHLFPQPQF